MGEELRVVVVEFWRAGRLSLEAWEWVWEWFWVDGNGDQEGKLAGKASRGPGPKKG